LLLAIGWAATLPFCAVYRKKAPPLLCRWRYTVLGSFEVQAFEQDTEPLFPLDRSLDDQHQLRPLTVP
jgi:hypothetical protein